MSTGIILYGPPASGKDTITRELAALDDRYVHFQRLKVGGGRTAEYRLTTQAELSDLADRGDLLYVNQRYDATYAVDRGGLDEITRRGWIPVLHLGQVAGITAVVEVSGGLARRRALELQGGNRAQARRARRYPAGRTARRVGRHTRRPSVSRSSDVHADTQHRHDRGRPSGKDH